MLHKEFVNVILTKNLYHPSVFFINWLLKDFRNLTFEEMLMTNIAGVFDRIADAKRAVSELLDAGFRKENVSLIVSRKGSRDVTAFLADTQKQRILKSGLG